MPRPTTNESYLAGSRVTELVGRGTLRKRNPTNRELRDMVRALAAVVFTIAENADDEVDQVDAVMLAHTAARDILTELEQPEPGGGQPG